MTNEPNQGIGRELGLLEGAGLIAMAASVPELEYLFRHALIQDAAYESLLKQERRSLHIEVAEALLELYPDHREDMAPVLAHHFERAEDQPRAVEYLALAPVAVDLPVWGHGTEVHDPGVRSWRYFFDDVGHLDKCIGHRSRQTRANAARARRTEGFRNPRGSRGVSRTCTRPGRWERLWRNERCGEAETPSRQGRTADRGHPPQ